VQCPSCGQATEAGAAFCFRCGAKLAGEPAEASPSAPDHKAAVPAVETPAPPVWHDPSEMELTHRGEVFGAGYGADFYGVWDLRAAGEPIARFDRTPIGWEAAWRRFQELEWEQAVPAWRRPGVGWILLHILVGLVALAFAQGFVIGIVLAAAGRSLDELAPRTEGALTLMAFTGLIAWLLFVYLKRSARVRWTVFISTLMGGFTLALIVALVAQGAT
jgi:hypothetical protein